MRCYSEFGGGKVFQIFTLAYYNTYLNTCPNKNVDDKLYCICLHRQTCFGQIFFFCSPHTRKYADGCFQRGKDTDIQWFTRFLLFSRNTHMQTLTHGLIPHSTEPTHTCRYSTDYQESRCNGHLGGKYKKRRQNNNQNKHLCILLVPLS